jgi:tRNA A37 threonylcarbamoyladenosine dehydratase
MEIKAKQTQERFKDAPFFNPNLSVIIAGLGGIGSHLSYILSRQGYDTYLYDFDTIDTVNVGKVDCP